jgi:hypothetical protein
MASTCLPLSWHVPPFLSLSLSLSKAYDYRPRGENQENSFETQHQKLPFVAIYHIVHTVC